MMDAKTESRAVTLTVGGKQRVYDIDLPDLPDWIEDEALKSGGFPYDKKLSEKDYLKVLVLSAFYIVILKKEFVQQLLCLGTRAFHAFWKLLMQCLWYQASANYLGN